MFSSQPLTLDVQLNQHTCALIERVAEWLLEVLAQKEVFDEIG